MKDKSHKKKHKNFEHNIFARRSISGQFKSILAMHHLTKLQYPNFERKSSEILPQLYWKYLLE